MWTGDWIGHSYLNSNGYSVETVSLFLETIIKLYVFEER